MAGTILNPGDIAFLNLDSGEAGQAEDTQFAFVTLTALAAGTTINFTDRGWNGTSFQAGTTASSDGTITYTATSAVSAGTIIVVARDATKGGATSLNGTAESTPPGDTQGYALTTNGTVAVLPSSAAGNFDLGNDGLSYIATDDQLFAYQGTDASPTFIAGLATGSGFLPSGSTISDTDPTQSLLPSGLVAGDTAITVADLKANYFDGPLSGTAAQIRAELNNPLGYHEAAVVYDVADGSVTVLAGSPTIAGTVAGQTTDREAPISPFGGVTITDPNSGATDAVTITLSGGGGVLSGAGLVANPDGSYTLTAASPATITSEIEALVFTPAAGAPGTTTTTTFALSDQSSAGATTVDGTTSVLDTSAALPPPPPPPPTPVIPDAVSIDPSVSYSDGVFTLTGSASSAAGVSSVEISAVIDDGTREVLGSATVDANGTFTFSDTIGASQQSFLVATLTSGAGATTTSADPEFSLAGGLDQGSFQALQYIYNADGSAVTATDSFRADGSRHVDVQAIGQTFTSYFFDTFQNHEAPDNTFVFDPGHGLDVIGQFRVDGTDHDTVSLLGSDFGDSIAQVLHNTKNVGGSAVITDPTSGDTIKLAGITKAELKANQGDFAFHA